jgi:hypothetical protein
MHAYVLIYVQMCIHVYSCADTYTSHISYISCKCSACTKAPSVVTRVQIHIHYTFLAYHVRVVHAQKLLVLLHLASYDVMHVSCM